jgi:hypothetical protein
MLVNGQLHALAASLYVETAPVFIAEVAGWKADMTYAC